MSLASSDPTWSIGVVHTPDIDELQQRLPAAPVIDARMVASLGGYGAADPFALRRDGTWYLFFEMLVRSSPARIAVARSDDLQKWDIVGTCEIAPHHLSFPYVFEHDGCIWMVPESRSVRRVDLYVATQFPLKWEHCNTIARGRLMDPTIFEWNNRFWMLAGWRSYWLRAYWSHRLDGEWHRHWMPSVRLYSKRDVRPAGRPVMIDGTLVRWVQDNQFGYGKQVRGRRITRLDRWWYSEQDFRAEPIMKPTGVGWNSFRAHHLDPHRANATEFPSGPWIGFVDGCNG